MNPMLAAFEWMELDTWTALVGMLAAMSCALLGNFLVLRKMSMMGDAISHAVLPGLAIAFLVTQSRDVVPMFIGATIAGVLTAAFTQWVHSFGKVDQGASMGVVFTVLFAIGLVLIVRAADAVDLDAGCVLYGAIELVPLDTRDVFGVQVPRAALTLGGVLLLNALVVVLLYKELKISSFDPELATTLGINGTMMHYLLMTLVAITTVAAFESVGSILVIAMLIVPGATAHLLADRLHSMILMSLVVAALSAFLGHLGAITLPEVLGFGAISTNTAGMMAVVAGFLFLLAALLSPRHGVVSKLVRRWALALQIVREDALGLLYRLEEREAGIRADLVPDLLRKARVSGSVLSRIALLGLQRGGQIGRAEGGYRLTPAGREHARRLIRSHRLWESYLEKHLPIPADHVHFGAHQLEHVTDARMEKRLAEQTDRPEHDPHGRPIPERPGDGAPGS